MLRFLNGWVKRYFSDEEVILLLLVLCGGFLLIISLGQMLAPVFTAIVLAYLLQGLVNMLCRWGLSKTISISTVYLLFLSSILLFFAVLLPMLWAQMGTFVKNTIPNIISEGQRLLLIFPHKYPGFITEQQANELIDHITRQAGSVGQKMLALSLTTLPNLVSIFIFIVLVPVLVFFFLKDKTLILNWCARWLPSESPLLRKIWADMHEQISNYVRGKVAEIVIVGGATYIAFVVMKIEYAELLALVVALSVVMPYIGATVVTVPVALVTYFQFGWTSEFATAMIVFGILQALDGYILVPLLFSEAVNLHPVAIILAMLLFGGVWGMWGVFFAIPLATLIKAVLDSWPRNSVLSDAQSPL